MPRRIVSTEWIRLQDIANQLGTRLGFRVAHGRYRGTRNEVGFDGMWAAADGYQLIVEIKTTDTYRINLDTIASYRSQLITSGAVKKDRSSILIVVGRQDTGDLEAQIRGSRHAWDVRLISMAAALRLIELKEGLSDWATSTRINEILKPVEYTRVDPIIDLIFTTSGEIAEESEHPAVETNGELCARQTEQRFDTASLRTLAVQRISAYRHLQFIKKGKVFYSSADGKFGWSASLRSRMRRLAGRATGTASNPARSGSSPRPRTEPFSSPAAHRTTCFSSLLRSFCLCSTA